MCPVIRSDDSAALHATDSPGALPCWARKMFECVTHTQNFMCIAVMVHWPWSSWSWSCLRWWGCIGHIKQSVLNPQKCGEYVANSMIGFWTKGNRGRTLQTDKTYDGWQQSWLQWCQAQSCVTKLGNLSTSGWHGSVEDAWRVIATRCHLEMRSLGTYET
jgi:hypothetical protein